MAGRGGKEEEALPFAAITLGLSEASGDVGDVDLDGLGFKVGMPVFYQLLRQRGVHAAGVDDKVGREH